MKNQLKKQFKKSFLTVKTEKLIAFKISQYVLKNKRGMFFDRFNLLVFILISGKKRFKFKYIYSTTMQSDEQRENYNATLDEIIGFFKNEKELWTSSIIIGREDSKFDLNVFLSLIVILVAVFNVLSNIESKFKYFILLFLSLLMIFIVIYMIIYLRDSKKRTVDLIIESMKYNIIINNLQSLKILPYKVDLSKLINKMKYRYHIMDRLYPYEKYMTETWFNEIDDCFDEINKEIPEKEKLSSLPK